MEDHRFFQWAEDWIQKKLLIRLFLYKKKYPMFDVQRFVYDLTRWPVDTKTQRWWPYMKDEDIKKMNVNRRKSRSIEKLAKGQS